ncbi:MAG: ABC transporter ATP-binding protein [Bacteroidales bacterium]|nr:ABC transporter ATP-binding protein [Bacteroidales bacterium]
MSHHYLQFKNVCFSYPNSNEILHDISFKINHGEHVALLGLNGSGKSTILLQTNGLLMPESGEVVVGDVPVTHKTLKLIRQTVGMVFQNSDDMLFMPSIKEDVAFGPRNMNLPDSEIERRVGFYLEAVGLKGMADRPAFSLSGGQRRAAAIASVLAMEPSVMVLDEPSANLDARARRQLMEIIDDFPHIILLATHDEEMAVTLCKRAILVHEGKIVFDGPTQIAIDHLHKLV